MFIINLPLSVATGKKKRFFLNLNQYRNTHFYELNAAKLEFKRIVTPLLKAIPHMQECTLEYVLYPPTKIRYDLGNVCSIQDKFFSDTLVEAGKIDDDNYLYVKSVKHSFGSLDKYNPRVEVIITPIGVIPSNQGKEDMQITLNQNEIETAVKDFVKKTINIREDQEIAVSIAATRGAEGFTATIDISQSNSGSQDSVAHQVVNTALTAGTAAETNQADTAVVTRPRGRPPGSTNAPKAEVTPAPTQVAPTVADTVAEYGTATLAEPAKETETQVAPVPQAAAGGSLFSRPATTATQPTPVEATLSADIAAASETVTQEEAPKTTSLFSSLSRPVNPA